MLARGRGGRCPGAREGARRPRAFRAGAPAGGAGGRAPAGAGERPGRRRPGGGRRRGAFAGGRLAGPPLRRRWPAGFLIGRSTHSPEEVAAAQREGCDYCGFGRSGRPRGKADASWPFRASRASTPPAGSGLPVLALGGVDDSGRRCWPRPDAGGGRRGRHPGLRGGRAGSRGIGRAPPATRWPAGAGR